MSGTEFVSPHRLLINQSLRKASAELRSHIDAYKTEYEQTVARCIADLKQAQNDKVKDLEKTKLSLIEGMKEEDKLNEQVKIGSLDYSDQVLQRKCLSKMKIIKKTEKQVLVEYKVFLSEQIDLITKDVEMLEVRKDILISQAKVDDIIELIRLTGSEVDVDDNDGALLLLSKVAEKVKTCEGHDDLRKQALQKLRRILQERVDLLPVIQYISWSIQQKKSMKRELFRERRKIDDSIKSKACEIREISENINTISCTLEVQARMVRMYWTIPVTQLNIQISYLNKELRDIFFEINQIGREIEDMKSIGSDDSETWDRLWYRKKCLKHRIPEAKNEIKALKSERQRWFSRQQILCSILKKNNIILLREGKGLASDEFLIIENRLAELMKIELEANKRDKIRFEQELFQIEQLRDSELNESYAMIANAEVIQSEKNAAVHQASIQLSKYKSSDSRSILQKLFSKNEDITNAKEAMKSAKLQKKRADSYLSDLNLELEKVMNNFDIQIKSCRLKPYEFSDSEKLEIEKLENRKSELINQQNLSKSILLEEKDED